MPHPPRSYRLAIRAAVPLVPWLLRDPRQREAHAARLAAPAGFRAWAAAHRDRRRPLAWFHAPSVGEGLQAVAVLEAYRRLVPEAQIAYTHFSPSAAGFASRVGADVAGYLPYDRPADMAAVLDALAPELLVFTKLDLWPTLATAAVARGTRVAMVAGTVSPASGRLRWPALEATRPGYEALTTVGAITADDAMRLGILGVGRDRITVTGDPRIDSVLAVVASAPVDDPLLALGDGATTMVAGSTWPDDELRLLGAFAEIRRSHPTARLVLVPHEPTAGHLAGCEGAARHLGLPVTRLSALAPGEAPPLVLVDRVGVLARLYRAGGMAYVGGGWGDRGIHSVLEPAAWAKPVIIGPHDRGSRDAELLRKAGALVRLETARDHGALLATWRDWLDHEAARVRAGTAARAVLERERGAAERSAALLAPSPARWDTHR